ncbi:mitochondrial K+-H+ exchange-related-domain-containing protein, partial [Pyronema domesticum]
MRLYLIPITSRRTLIYGQRLNKITHAVPSYMDKVSAKAAKLWLSWESAEKGWQKKVAEYGNKLFDRIPYEEWALKSIPPLSARRPEELTTPSTPVEVIYPPSIISPSQIPSILRSLGTSSKAYHKRHLVWSCIGMPIVVPFALVPVIPNLPFFYLAYRAFCHWKALLGAKHLEWLATKAQENDAVLKAVGSNVLDAVYERRRLSAANRVGLDRRTDWMQGGRDGADRLLIEAEDAQEIAKALDFPELAVECERACKQISEEMK